MALKLETEFVGKINAGDANYPQGSYRDITSPSDGTGTPFVARGNNDIQGLLQKLLDVAGITPSGSPDTVLLSDYFDGLMTVVTRPIPTIAIMVALTDVKVGNVLRIADRANGLFDVVLTSSVTPLPANADGKDIIESTADPLISFVLRIDDSLYIRRLGVTGSGDETTGWARFLTIITDRNIRGYTDGIAYSVSAQLIDKVASCEFHLESPLAPASITYTGSAIGNLIQVREAEDAFVRNITINCANLISNPLSIRSTSSDPGYVEIKGCNISNVAQTTQSVNAVAIEVGGKYKTIDITRTTIDVVSRVDVAKFCNGIFVFGTTGNVNITHNKVANISSPDDKDADGITVFGAQNATSTGLDTGLVTISNNELIDCKGRFIKSQHSNTIVDKNTGTLSAGFTVITNWNYADFQMSNGKFTNNHWKIEAGVTLNSAAYCQFQNLKDVDRKQSVCSGNTLDTTVKIPFFVLSGMANGEITVQINNNPLSQVATFCKHTGATAAFDSGFYHISDNPAEIKNHFFEGPASTFANLLVRCTDNTNTDTNTLNFRNIINLNGINLGTNFVFKNNKGFKDEVTWAFNADDLNDGNTFVVGAQSNSNDPVAIGTGAHWETEGFKQKAVTSDGVTEFMRTSVDFGANWGAWRSVTFT